MRPLREGELDVYLPEGMAARRIDLAAAEKGIECGQSCLAVEMDPPRQTKGEILIPETVGARLRADAGTIVSVGTGVDLEVGDRVLVRPYHGLWFDPFDCRQIVEKEFPASPIRACNGNAIIIVDEQESWTDLVLPDRLSATQVSTGRIVDACSSWLLPGDKVVFSNYHPKTMRYGPDHIDDGIVSVPQNHVFAKLHYSSYEAQQVRFYGGCEPWRMSILMVQRAGQWVPIDPWVMIERDEQPVEGIVLAEHAAAQIRDSARVVRWHNDNVTPGTKIVLDPNPNHAISFAIGEMGAMRQLVPQSEIWATVE